jgi:hypothetical protein
MFGFERKWCNAATNVAGMEGKSKAIVRNTEEVSASSKHY